MRKQHTGTGNLSSKLMAEGYIPGTAIPKTFYTTIAIDLEKTLKEPAVSLQKYFESEARSIFHFAERRLREYRLRWRIFKAYGVDVGDGFEMDYSFYWVDIDGIIQLLRGDFLPISKRSIDAEIDCLDGKLEPDVDGILMPVKDSRPFPQTGVDNQPIDLERRSL